MRHFGSSSALVSFDGAASVPDLYLAQNGMKEVSEIAAKEFAVKVLVGVKQGRKKRRDLQKSNSKNSD